MGERLRTLETPDGRTLAYATWGDPDGFPILSLHGTPGCRFNRWPNEDAYSRVGVHYVTHDRAGYGRSDRHHGRSVADEAADVAALADELGLDRFGVAGGSGGGPHVLACAALLSDRVVRAVCAVGVAPFGPPGLEEDDWFAGMDEENVKEERMALAGEEALTPYLEEQQRIGEERVAIDPSTILDDFELSESDRAQLARPEVVQLIRESTSEQAANGVGGWVDDDLAFLKPWGFDVAAVSVPVLIRYGLTDVLVPPAHGEWLAANVPGCIVAVDSSAGHLGDDPEEQIARDARWLRDGIAPEGARSPGQTA
ncbi:MAG TPA: alpha/beta hydrolase [Gaiellaceae bacterium]|nr:alpha/beta hydrolase [Gaiellaceae bacterium]